MFCNETVVSSPCQGSRPVRGRGACASRLRGRRPGTTLPPSRTPRSACIVPRRTGSAPTWCSDTRSPSGGRRAGVRQRPARSAARRRDNTMRRQVLAATDQDKVIGKGPLEKAGKTSTKPSKTSRSDARHADPSARGAARREHGLRRSDDLGAAVAVRRPRPHDVDHNHPGRSRAGRAAAADHGAGSSASWTGRCRSIG